MEVLFHSKFLRHNPGSYAEGPYRIEGFKTAAKDVDRNGEEDLQLIHSESHVNLIRDACTNQQVLAELVDIWSQGELQIR